MKRSFLLPLLLVLAFTGPAQNAHSGLVPDSLSHHPVHMARINGLDYFYIEKGEGPTIFFLHGFPDLAGTWDEAIDSLSGQYHCVAPFLRGYYPTSIAENGDYSTRTIAGDICVLADHLRVDSFYLVGQDWGASVVYSLVNLAPQRVIKAITIAIPHPSTIRITPALAFKARHFLKFRNEKKSPGQLKKHDFHYLDVLYERWSPGWEDYPATSARVKQTFARPGRTEAALGYYWSLNRNADNEELQEFYQRLPEVPLLAIAGKQDGALVMKPFYEMRKTMPGVKVVIHDQAGHFLHREVPGFFLEQLRDFFGE